MENIGGGLGFKATLDIDDFNVSAQAMERQIKNFSNTAAQEAAAVEESFQQMAQKAGQYISYYLIGQGMSNLVGSIVSVRGQFQQLEIAFGTMLGSGEKANALMQQMVDTAAKTPFDLMGVAEGAKQLLAYGVSADKVNDTLVRLGNIASGLSIPLNDIVYLYGTTMVQGRLYAQDVRQFTGRGIPLVKELADKYGVTAEKINEMVSAGKIGFPDVEEVINKMTNAGGQFYQLMEKQSSSLTGQIANLEDAWDSTLNSFGEQTEGALSAGIQSATYVVEHMDDIVRILKSVAIAYGSVKAATILTSVATKGYTGITVLDNAAKTAQLALMKAQMALSGETINQKKAMTAAEQANYAALATTLTAEEKAAVTKQMRIAAIQSLLTTQQQEYLSNLNLTVSSQGYEAAAVGVMTAEQRLALQKQDLTTKSAAYRAAIMQEAQAKAANQAQTVEAMRSEVKAAAQSVEAAKTKAVAATQATEAARYEVYWAKQSGNATAVASAQKKLDAAVDTQAAARKAALAAQTNFYAKKKQLETAATIQSRTASIADTAAKTAQSAATNILSAATSKLAAGMKALWATMVANPLGAIVAALGLIWSAFELIGNKADDAAGSVEHFGSAGESQLANAQVLYSVLQNAEKGTSAYKKAFDELNAKLEENNLKTLDSGASAEEMTEAYNRLTQALKDNNEETSRANSLKASEEEYTKSLQDLRSTVLEELKSAHHYNWSDFFGIGYSTDSEDIQNIATPLAQAVSNAIESALPQMVELDDEKKEEAKIRLRLQITEILKGAGVDESHAEFITKYDWLSDSFKDVFSGDGGIIDQALKAKEAFVSQTEAANKGADAQKEWGKAAQEAAPQIDISKLSLNELRDVASKLNGKSVEIDCKTYGFENALSLLQAVNNEINKQQNDLNTESGISAEIQELKKLRSEAQLGSQAWKDYNTQITKLQTRLNNATGKSNSSSSRKSDNDTQRNADDLKQKQLEADKRLEKARITVMEEGYEKRKALLDLQHKESLEQIDKEERELANARKKAGKGGLTSDEKANFQERRSLENESYTQSQNKLYEGELDEKKKQYQLYFRWVENMGEDVADKQFAKLLADGNSYKQYVENEIAKLEAKRSSGTQLTEGESNYLISLNTQRDELNGETTALEKFKQQVSDSISQCQTLAEKIEAVARAKEQLENGKSGIVSTDERASASVNLSQQEADLQKELEQTILNDFKSYEEKRKEIEANYNAMRLTQLAQSNAELLAQINQGEAAALSELDAAKLKASTEWKSLFTNLNVLSASEIDKLIKKIEQAMAGGDLKLSPVDYKATLDSLNQAKSRMVQLNPFKALGSGFNDYITATEKLKNAEKKNLSPEQIANFKQQAQTAAQQITNSFASITSAIGSIGSAFSSLASSFGNDDLADTISGVTEVMSGAGEAAQGVGKIMSGDLLGGITSVVSGVTSVIGSFNKMHDKKNEKRIQAMQEQIEELGDAYDDLGDSISHAYSTDKKNLLDAQNSNLEQQNELIRKQIEEEKDKKDTDWDRIKEWEEQIEENEKKIAENKKYKAVEAIMGTDIASAIDEFAEAYAEAWAKGEKAASKSCSIVKQLIKTAIIEQLKSKLKPEVEEFMQFLAKALEDGIIDEAEQKMLDEYEARLEKTSDEYLSSRQKYLEDDDTTSDPLTGAVKSLSEETGGVIAGRMNAFVINQGEQTSVLRNMLLQQSTIARNTGMSVERLQNIEDTLKRIETKNNSLLSQGIS